MLMVYDDDFRTQVLTFNLKLQLPRVSIDSELPVSSAVQAVGQWDLTFIGGWRCAGGGSAAEQSGQQQVQCWEFINRLEIETRLQWIVSCV